MGVTDDARKIGRVVVVGGGFVGAAVGCSLADAGAGVTILTRSESRRARMARAHGAHVVIGDAVDAAVVEEVLDGVDHVVYAVSSLSPPAAARRPCDDAVHMMLPLVTTLEALTRHPGIGVTYVSSGGTVYGNPARVPVREVDIVAPVSPYGVSRLAGELYVQMYTRTYGVRSRIVRCANLYGSDQSHDGDQGAVAVFLHRVAAGLPITVIGDGSDVRDYLHIADAAAAVSQLVIGDVDVPVVNLGSGRGHTVMELLACVCATLGRSAVLEFAPARRHDVRSIVLDISLLQNLVDFHPMSLETGLRMTVLGDATVWTTDAASISLPLGDLAEVGDVGHAAAAT